MVIDFVVFVIVAGAYVVADVTAVTADDDNDLVI